MPKSNEADMSPLLRQMEEAKNAELKRQRDEFKRSSDSLKNEFAELCKKNDDFEREIRDLQEKLGKRSNVGWMKDDIDVQKDSALKQKQEIEKLNILLEDYEKQVEELKTKWKAKEGNLKKKHLKELNEKEDEIVSLRAKLAEYKNSVGKTNQQMLHRLEELQDQLDEEKRIRSQNEVELADLKSRPPPVTPRQAPARPASPPQRQKPHKPAEEKSKVKRNQAAETLIDSVHASAQLSHDDIYLPEYCPLTLKAFQKNPNVLAKYKEAAVKYFNDELDNMGIDPNEKYLSTNDYMQKSNSLKVFRKDTEKELPIFSEVRQVFSELCEKYANQRLNMSLKSTGNRVTFKQDLVANKEGKMKNSNNRPSSLLNALLPNTNKNNNNNSLNKSLENTKTINESEETDDDVSLSNALESEDDEDTEPTKSLVNENSQAKESNKRSPRKNLSASFNQDPEISDLESISQLLTDRSGPRRKNQNNTAKSMNSIKSNSKAKPSSRMEENRKRIEEQLKKSSTNSSRPTPNAVAVGFQSTASRLANQSNAKTENSFSDISDLENETNQRPKSGLRSSLSNSSSVWISETHESHVPNNQQQRQLESERPATANSLKTSNFDSDEETVLN